MNPTSLQQTAALHQYIKLKHVIEKLYISILA
jgi:hypothetical protein